MGSGPCCAGSETALTEASSAAKTATCIARRTLSCCHYDFSIARSGSALCFAVSPRHNSLFIVYPHGRSRGDRPLCGASRSLL